MEELAKEQKRKAKERTNEFKEAGVDSCETIGNQQHSAGSMLEFLEKARKGEMIPNDVIIRYSTYFQDDLTLDNMPRMQLVNMCRYMGIPPYGSDNFLRFQLRHKIRVLKEDDQRILWEGIDTLTKMELREACQERGMRSTDLTKDTYKRALQQWIDLSVSKDVPIALLIMSRAFFLREDMYDTKTDGDESSQTLTGLVDTISGMDKEVLNEVILNVATSEEQRADPSVRKIKLEVLSKQNELIKQEEEAREAAKKREKEALAAKEAKGASSKEAKPTLTTPVIDVSAEVITETTTSFSVPPGARENADSMGASLDVSKDMNEEEEEEWDLSAREIDALSSLVSDDPVSKERADLQKIKKAIQDDDDTKVEEIVSIVDAVPNDVSQGMMSSDEADNLVMSAIAKEKKQLDEATATTASMSSFDTDVSDSSDVKEEEENKEDPVVRRLKKRVKSMVENIELKLTETEGKIGAKLHLLDKDGDGIVTAAEMAEVLVDVMKRKISFEDALELAHEMDRNNDGAFTVQEFAAWINENKLEKFVQEGRETEMDDMLEEVSSSMTESKSNEAPKQ